MCGLELSEWLLGQDVRAENHVVKGQIQGASPDLAEYCIYRAEGRLESAKQADRNKPARGHNRFEITFLSGPWNNSDVRKCQKPPTSKQ